MVVHHASSNRVRNRGRLEVVEHHRTRRGVVHVQKVEEQVPVEDHVYSHHDRRVVGCRDPEVERHREGNHGEVASKGVVDHIDRKPMGVAVAICPHHNCWHRSHCVDLLVVFPKSNRYN